MKKPTLVIGASPNPERFAFLAIKSLLVNDHKVFAIGLKKGKVHGIRILTPFPKLPPVHTVTMYVGKKNQPLYYDYILALQVKRVIFNPGSENEEFELLLMENGIEVIHDCTLLMLSQGSY